MARELSAAGWRVVALHRPGSNTSHLRALNVELVEGTILDRGSLERTMPQNADAVFHVAGNTSFWSRRNAEQTLDNVKGTANVADAALSRGARRLVQTSSIAAFGHHEQRVTEETLSNAAGSRINYYRTKWLAELEVEKRIGRGLDAVFINPAHIVGSFDLTNWSRMFRMVNEGKLRGAPPGRGSWCHVNEVARAHLAAADRGRTGHRYLLGGVDASFLEAIQVIGRLTGKKVPDKAMHPAILHFVARASDLFSLISGKEPDITREGAALICETMVCDCSKAIRELGYQPVALEVMFEDCFRWMVAERML